MGTPRKPGLPGKTRSRGDNLDDGRTIDERTASERSSEGRSRKAADNALDRTSPAERRAGWSKAGRSK